MKTAFLSASGLLLSMIVATAAPISPRTSTKITIDGKTISIDYSAPSVKGRKIFGEGGRISHDPNYPVWRAGADSATAFHTDADLTVGDISVPKGDYTLYVLVADPDQWQLIINKQTGQWGLTYNQDRDLARIKMNMSKPPAPIETLKYTLTQEGGGKVKLQLAWDNHVASVPLTVK